MTIPSSELWGDKTYGDGVTPVPKVAARCKSSASKSSNAHVCKLHHAHKGEHRCVCGKKWSGVAS
ncbi:hypothetical protein P2P98_13130 [Microbacterium sp. Kw_RZR3]|uniref:hypothetical protein n=1 Tax=Microbacterium sp. Kw_RZR3 TaxID=3032903 RepID=UPI0023DA3609|nr:hypothetical protein [Microbacterium sp. Kw_RZR3]MDF2047104.1 hypothetical protein [Microbacterium sp. Kw_RZR3]